MALACPNKSHPLYKNVLTLVGGDERALYRLFTYYNQSNPGEELEKIVDTYSVNLNPIVTRINAVKKAKGTLLRDDELHRYYFPETPGVEIQSVSRSIDANIPELAFQGSTDKTGYSDTGTKIHETASSMFSLNERNLRKKMEEWNLPQEIYTPLKQKLNELTLDGSVLMFEPMLYSGIFDQNTNPIAGAADIIRFRPDGTYQIIDIKTAYLTPKVRTYLKKNPSSRIWNPTMDNNFKAKRYSVQSMAYGRLVEKVLGIAASDYMILPVEIETEGDSDRGRILKADILPFESIEKYGFKDYANKQLDSIFKQKSFEPSTISSSRFKDILADFYTKLTGNVTNSTGNPKEVAEIIHRRGGKQGIQKGYFANGAFIPYKNQQSKPAQIEQIVQEFVNRDIKEDMESSIMNYLNSPTGDQSYLNNMGVAAQNVIHFLKPFAGRKDIVVSSLNSIPGFEDKLNWILITEKYEKSSITHLLYVGQDNFSSTFVTKNFNVFDNFVSNSSIFGQLISENEARAEIGTNLKNNVGDARVLEATMIAMRLKADNPNIKFGIMNLFGMSGSTTGRVVDLKENLQTVKAALDNKTLRDELFTTNFVELANVPGIFDYESYQGSWLDSLMHSFETYYSQYDKYGIISKLKDYSADALRKNELMESIAEMINDKIKMGVSPTNDYNLFLLSRFYLQLKGINVSLTPSNVFAVAAGVPNLIKNSMLQKLQGLLHNAQSKMIDDFWKYKDSHVKSIKALFKSKAISAQAADYLVGNTTRHYSNLFKKMKVKVATQTGFEEKEVPIFEFKSEGSAEFAALTKEEQDFIVATNDALQSLAKESGIEWQRGVVPMVRAKTTEKFYAALRSSNREFTSVVNDYLIDLDASFGSGEDSRPNLDNIFRSQAGESAEEKRLQKMGLQSEGYLNESEYKKYSFNVEMIADVFAMQSLKYKHMNDISASMRAANNVFNWYKSELLGDRLDSNIEFLNNLFTINVEGSDLDKTETEKKASRYMRQLSTAASIYYIGLDFVSATVAAVGNELTLFSQAIANQVAGMTGIKPVTYAKAKGVVTKALAHKVIPGSAFTDYDKVSSLMRLFRMMNNDVTQMLSGYWREGEKFLFQGKYLFAPMNGAEWQSRATLMIGQMLDEGSWDAYSIDSNGNLAYDETKDLRFNGKGKYTLEEGVAIKKMIAESLGVNPNDKLPAGHTLEMTNNVRNLGNFFFGGADRETKSYFNFRWWGKLFISMKNFLPAKIQRWTMSKVDSETMGHLKIETNPKTGEKVAIWEGDQMEGIFLSMAAFGNYLRKTALKMETKPLTKFQKNNVTRALGDVILVLGATLAYMAIPDDDDETVYDDVTAEIIRRALDDLLVIYNVLKFDEYFYTPIPLKAANTIVTNVGRLFTGGPTLEEAAQFLPGGASVIQTYNMLEIEEEENENQ